MEAAMNITRIDVLYQSDTNQTTSTNPVGGTLVDPFTHKVFHAVNFIGLGGCIGVFGTVTNIINMVVFFRMGLFTSISNLNLFSLAIADLGVSVTTLLQAPGFILTAAKVDNLNWDPFDVFYITVAWPSVIFVMANRLMTSYVAFERCVCVVLPFKVRVLFTLRRSLICILVIFAYSCISMVPVFATHSLQFVLQDGTNVSKLVLVLSPERDIVYEIYMKTNIFALSFATVVFLFVVTLITSSRLRLSKEWRKSVSVKVDQTPSVCPPNTSDNGHTTDTLKNGRLTDERIDKETRLVKMITLISVMYLILYLPEIMLLCVMLIDKRISTFGQYWRLSQILYSFNIPITATNSSINIFFYYKMSTAYRREFRKLFGQSYA